MSLFQGGTLVTSQGVMQADLRTEGEKIAEIAPGLVPLRGERVYEVPGKLLLPGVIDAHTHFLLKSRNSVTADDAFSGSKAAAMGGVTTVIDYADLLPDRPLLEGVNARRRDFLDAAVDYNFHLVVNDNYNPAQAREFPLLLKAGIASVKLFTTYRDAGYMLSEVKWQSILAACRETGLVVTVHAEDDAAVQAGIQQGIGTGRLEPRDHPDLRPAQAEVIAVQKLIRLAEDSGCTIYIVHLSSGSACRLVWEAKERGAPVLVETTPHYLLLERSLLEREGGRNHLMTPPLRECQDNRILWQGVEDGTISVVATDHCAFTPDQKAMGKSALDILPGIPGVETLLPMIYTYGVAEGRIGLSRLVQLLAENPARIFGLWPRKGGLVPGADADIAVYNPEPIVQLSNAHIHSQAGYTSFAGFNVRGQVEMTMLRGSVLVEDGAFRGSRGQGKFIPGGERTVI